MQRRVLAAVLVLASPAAADTLTPADDPGTITDIDSGVSEVALGAMSIVSYHGEGATSSTRVDLLLSAGYRYFVSTNVSIGGDLLFDQDRTSDTSTSRALGGAATVTLHERLGFGVFVRPTLALGVLFGSREQDTGMPDLVMQTSQNAFLTRLQLPLAFYPSHRVVLQAGPELDLALGSVGEATGRSSGYTTLASGFSFGFGYVF